MTDRTESARTGAHVRPDEARKPGALAARYTAMPHEYERRPVDLALRALDIVIATLVLVAGAPLMAAAAAAVRVGAGSPVLYHGVRVGRGGELFEMVKFRTLRPGAESRLGSTYGRELTEATSAEVTEVGRILRVAHLDELPQFWNVLRGEMSIVGPRPVRPSFFATLTEEVPLYWQRLVIPPGITGFAQLRMTREEAWADKLAHDLEYIADRSVALYVGVVAGTARRVASRTLTGARRRMGRDGSRD